MKKNALFYSLIAIFSIFTSSCSSRSEVGKNIVSMPTEETKKINSMYYNFSDEGIKGAEFECKSHFFDEMVSRIKDPVAKSQLQKTIFKVKWVKPIKFYGRADNIPEMPSKSDTQLVAKAVIDAKNRIRDAIQMDSFFFDNIFPSESVQVARQSGYSDFKDVFVVLDSKQQLILRLFFKDNLLLDKIEILNNGKVTSKATYQFELLPNGKYLLKSASVFDLSTGICRTVTVSYETKNSLILPKQIIIESKKRAAAASDTIDIVAYNPVL